MEGEAAQEFIQRVLRARSRYEKRLQRDRRLALALSAERGEAALPLQALRDEDAWVRRAAAALGEIGDPGAVPSLLAAPRDEDAWVRRAAAELEKVIQGLPAPQNSDERRARIRRLRFWAEQAASIPEQ